MCISDQGSGNDSSTWKKPDATRELDGEGLEGVDRAEMEVDSGMYAAALGPAVAVRAVVVDALIEGNVPTSSSDMKIGGDGTADDGAGGWIVSRV